MPRFFCLTFLTLILSFVSASAAPEEEWKQKLQNAEAQLAATYAQVEAQLDPAQKLKLQAAQKAWEEYRKLTVESFTLRSMRYPLDEGTKSLFSATLVWFRVSHLSRMLEHRDLKGSDSDLRDADVGIDEYYKWLRDCSKSRGQRDAYKEVQLSWIAFRDASVDSESLACPNPASASVRIKTELTYERIIFMDEKELEISQRLTNGPPDLEKEMYFMTLLSRNPQTRQNAIDYFCAHTEESLPFLTELIKAGMLHGSAAPLFEKLGPAAIPSLLELLGKSAPGTTSLSALLAATGPAVIPELVARISSSDIQTSLECLKALEILGPKAQDALPSILEIIREPKRDTSEWRRKRYGAIQAALSIAPKDPEVAKTIVDSFLAAPTFDSRELDALGKLGHAARDTLPLLIQQASSQDYIPLNKIISADDIDLMPSLIQGLADPQNAHWGNFGLALAQLGDPAASQLAALLQSSDKEIVRRAVAALSYLSPPSDEAVLALVSMTTKEDVFEAIFYIDMIAEYKESAKAAVPAFLSLYKSNRKGVSSAALHALRAIAPDSEEVKSLGLPEPFVSDPFYDAECYREPGGIERSPNYMIEADFNNDGAIDTAVSCPLDDVGMGTGLWTLYLRVAEDKFKRVGHFRALYDVKLFAKEEEHGIGYMGVYWEDESYMGIEDLYKITMEEIKQVDQVSVEWIGDEERTVDSEKELPVPKGYTETKLHAKPIEKEVLLGKKSETQITPSNN
ncbi:MAG: DUF1311 domain-containing protein [Candidatus Hydrogenedentes bacterium]|nr:DUF1311 domain-containing protein [Candidatus Hydrogenedentota bacterium]